MNIHVTIIEDEERFAQDLTEKIRNWFHAHHLEVAVKWYPSSHHIFFTSSYLATDVYFLDISLKEENGVDIAKKLRAHNYKGHIIFLTGFQEYVFEGYSVRALDYLLKPIDSVKLDRDLEMIAEELSDQNYMVRTRSEMYKIPYKEILYISSSNHSIEIITEKEKFRQMISLREVLSHLPAYFQQCHRTIIINMKKVTCLTDNWVVLNGKEELPVGKKYLEKIRSAFLSQ